jgi:hypothetical protein
MSTATKTKQNDLLALDANQATISTATVTIRTLRVNNKQLTQATFRQLPVCELIDENKLEVLGVVWGWVNYAPTAQSSQTRQFVAQFGDELCRCPFHVRKVPETHGCWKLESKADYQQALCVKEFMLRALAEDERITSFDWYRNQRGFPVPSPGVFGCSYISYSTGWLDPLGDYLNPKPQEYWVPITRDSGCEGREVVKTAEEVKEAARNRFIKSFQEAYPTRYKTPATLAEVRDAMMNNSREAVEYAAEWNALMERLKTAPQLFIAV